MALQSDPVADAVARGGPQELANRGGAEVLCGYVQVTSSHAVVLGADGKPAVNDEGLVAFETVQTARIYTTQACDQWVEFPFDSALHQLPDRSEDQQRSLLWLPAGLPVTHCRATTPAEVAQTLSSGVDDPTAYPGKTR